MDRIHALLRLICPITLLPPLPILVLVLPKRFTWKQQDQLILNVVLSSLSIDVLHLVVDCPTLASVWSTQERALASQSNFRIMQLHGSLQDLRQGDDTVTLYLQKAKGLFDKLAVAGRPISLTDFNLYVFLCLCGEFGDLVTSLSTKAEPFTYSELHSHLSTYEFLHWSSLQSIQAIGPLLPTTSHPPSAYAAQRAFAGFNDSGSSSHQGKGRRGGWKGNSRSNYNKYPVQPYHGNTRSSS